MNFLVGLVIRTQFQEVLSRTNGGKVGLFQLSMITIDTEKQHEIDENVIVFKVWGNHGKDKLRHQICRGSIVVIDEVDRKRFSNNRVIGGDYSDTIFGNILAFTDFNSNDVIIYDKHPFICSDMIVRSTIINLVNKLNDVVSHTMQWSMLRSCSVKSQYKLDFHSMLTDTKATLYTVPMKLFMLPLLSKSTGDIYVMDNDGVCVKFHFSNTSSRLSFISAVRDVLENNEIFPTLSKRFVDSYQHDNHMDAEYCLENAINTLSTDAKQFVFKEDDLSLSRSSEFGSVVLSLLFENIAINSSYQHQISSLRFIPYLSKIKLHCPNNQRPKTISNSTTNGQIGAQITEPVISSLNEVPEVHFYTWKQMTKLLSSLSVSTNYKSTVSSPSSILDNNNIPDIVPYPEGYILLLAYVHEVHFHGTDKESFHHNIAVHESGNTVDDQSWYYRDAMITLSPVGNDFDSTVKSIEEIENSVCSIIYKRFMAGSDTRSTLADQISQVILSTQCPFTCYSEPSSHSNDVRAPLESLLNRKPLLRTKDIIYAILQYYLCQAVADSSQLPQANVQPRNRQPFENAENVRNGKRKFPEFQDDASNISIIPGNRRSDSTWRFSAPSLISQELNPMLDKGRSDKFHDLEVLFSERCTSMEQTLFESPKIQLPVLISHEYQLNRLFCGISPKLVALDMYRQESEASAQSNVNNDCSSNIPYFKVCLSRLNKLLSLTQQEKHQQKPHFFVCRLIPTVDEDGDMTGDIILSLEDII